MTAIKSKVPFVSVIVVNYNGTEYLPTCLDTLQGSTYPKESFEVIVSDNNSKDGSLDLLQSQYSWIRVLENRRNLGFASGNNVAIQAARGDYVALINNDTLASPNWLEELVKVAENNSRAGLVTGRLQFFYDQLILQISTDAVSPDGREPNIELYAVDSGVPRSLVQYLEGFDGWDYGNPGRIFRRVKNHARIGVSVPCGNDDWPLRLRLSASRAPTRVQVSTLDGAHTDWTVSSEQPSDYEIRIPKSARALARPVLQSAGSILFRTGSSRDRGCYVRNGEVFYEIDEGQNNQVEQVFSGCGANLLIRRAVIDQVGAFDDDFFMYYEDTDLAWRARLQGWQVLYAPNAIVRHIHCGTAEEWSPFFFFQVERNRLAMVFKNGSRRQIISTWARFMSSIVQNTLIAARAFLYRHPMPKSFSNHVRAQYRALGALLLWIPGLVGKRLKIQKARTVPLNEIEKWFVD